MMENIMINIRSAIFETNSSSSHSISISSSKGMMDTLPVDDDGFVHLYGGQFGWGYENYTDPQTKASYCAVDLWYAENPSRGNILPEVIHRRFMFEKVICDQTGAKGIVYDFSLDYSGGNFSYIDHQSVGTSFEAFTDEETLRNFIFNPESELVIDNDNH